MTDILLDWLKSALLSPLDWLTDMWNSIGTTIPVLFFTFFALFTFVRLILFPLIGRAVSAGQSDRVRSTTTYKPFKTADGSTWYSASTSYTKRG